jgi:hypothetical protein
MDNEEPQEPEQEPEHEPRRFGPHGLAFPSELLSERARQLLRDMPEGEKRSLLEEVFAKFQADATEIMEKAIRERFGRED